MDRTIVFWGKEDDEHLTYSEMDDAIESMLDGMDDIKDLPKTIDVCGYAYMKPNPGSTSEHVLEHLLEHLDEEYSDPDGSYAAPTDSMKEAAKAFVTAVLDEYTVWACDLVKRETVNVQAWIKANRPDWLDECHEGIETKVKPWPKGKHRRQEDN